MATALHGEPDGWLSECHSDLVGFLVDMVAIPSDNPPGDCAAIATRVERELDALGLASERHDIPRPQPAPPAPTILAWLGPPTDTPRVLLNAHIDVIPPGEGWSVDPYGGGVVDGRVYGRGAAVSKSDVAVYAYALAAARRRLGTPRATAVLAVTSDEETGGDLGPAWLVGARGMRPEMAISAGVTHRVGIAHNGCIQARVVINGRSSHAAMPFPRADSLRVTCDMLAALYRYDETLATRRSATPGIERATVAVTSLHAGDVQGATAGSAELGIDRRVTPEESLDDAVNELRAVLESVDAADCTIAFEPSLVVPPLTPVDGQAELASLIQSEASRVLGSEIPLRGVPIFSDARWFGNAGIPTVMFGAGPANLAEARGHAPDENVSVDDVIAASHILAEALVSLLSPR